MAFLPISTGSWLKPRRLPSALRLGAILGVGVVLALTPPVSGQESPLPPDRAFRFTARALNPETIETRFTIADGYYLYRDRIHLSVEPATTAVTVPPLPEGKVKEDQFWTHADLSR